MLNSSCQKGLTLGQRYLSNTFPAALLWPPLHPWTSCFNDFFPLWIQDPDSDQLQMSITFKMGQKIPFWAVWKTTDTLAGLHLKARESKSRHLCRLERCRSSRKRKKRTTEALTWTSTLQSHRAPSESLKHLLHLLLSLLSTRLSSGVKEITCQVSAKSPETQPKASKALLFCHTAHRCRHLWGVHT